jgi:hypothetical protein
MLPNPTTKYSAITSNIIPAASSFFIGHHRLSFLSIL